MTTAILPAPLDVSAPATFDRWCALPEDDTRTLEEFAAAGGRPLPPQNVRMKR